MGDSAERRSIRDLLTDRLGRWSIRSVQVLAIIALASAVVFGLLHLTLVVVPLIIALILASAVSPVLGWLRRHGVSAMIATWLTLLAAVVIIGGILTFVVFTVSNQWAQLASQAEDGFAQFQGWLNQGPIQISQAQINNARDSVVDFLSSRQFSSGAIAGVSSVAQVITAAVLTAVILFFFLKDGDKIWAFFLRPLSGERLDRGRRIGRTVVAVFGGYVRGTIVIAFVDAAAIGIGLAILHVPLAFPLAIIVFLTAFIPLIGAVLAGGLAALVALVASGPVTALIVVLIVIAVNQLEGNFLQPVVMAQSLKLHALVILIALTAGTLLGGIIGAVLAVPITAVGWGIIKVWDEAGET